MKTILVCIMGALICWGTMAGLEKVDPAPVLVRERTIIVTKRALPTNEVLERSQDTYDAIRLRK